MLFQHCQPRFNPGCGKTLASKNNPCKYNKKIIPTSNNSLRTNMIFCMTPKPRCNSCR